MKLTVKRTEIEFDGTDEELESLIGGSQESVLVSKEEGDSQSDQQLAVIQSPYFKNIQRK